MQPAHYDRMLLALTENAAAVLLLSSFFFFLFFLAMKIALTRLGTVGFSNAQLFLLHCQLTGPVRPPNATAPSVL